MCLHPCGMCASNPDAEVDMSLTIHEGPSLIHIKVVPKARMEKVETRDGTYKVWVKEPAAEGRANEAVVRVLAEYFNVRQQDVRILRGLKGRSKTVIVRHAT